MPAPVEVVIPEAPTIDDRRIPTLTHLFRNGSHLHLVSRLTRERAGDEGFSFGSVGCSNGAEVDSMLALHDNGGHEGSLTAAGFDINPEAIKAARRGVYTMRRTFFAPFGYPPQEGTLMNMGFGVSYTHATFSLFVPTTGFRVNIDAGPVREGHRVEFVEHDAAEPLPVAGPQDLMMANNILYHLRDAKAAQVVRNMASVLSDRGLLSFGGSTLAADSPLETERITGLLDEEFDMAPVYTDSNGTPVIFGRA